MEAVDWPYKLLSRERHSRLVDDLVDVSRAAGVPADMIDQSMHDAGCSEAEITWVREEFTRLEGASHKGGLILVGRKFSPSPEVRLMAMGAAFIRNFIDARVVSLYSLLPMGSSEAIDPTVLIIPNLHRVSTTGGHTLTNWQLQFVHGLLLERFAARRATIMHVDDMKALGTDYGLSFQDFLFQNWDEIASAAG